MKTTGRLSPSLLLCAAADGENDTDFVVRLNCRVEVGRDALIDKELDVLAQLSLFVHNAKFETGKIFFERVHHCAQGCAARFDDALSARVFA